jgi:hypothetical protein
MASQLRRGRSGIDEDAFIVANERGRELADTDFFRSIPLLARRQRRVSLDDRWENGPTVGALDQTVRAQLNEVPARGRRRDPEPANQPIQIHPTLLAQELEYLGLSFCGELGGG